MIDFKETRVVGDEAFEWARTRVSIKPVGANTGMRAEGNLMRILRRQKDGTWKVARAIWNLETPARIGQ